ncbi:Oligopeptide transporter 4 [Triticum urartu]|uniref:Oligopeptide transporter 4 n=1 Tax=Triticum urartu TaxID=4572 RepID=M7ZWY3_TRIUA|nr:Oligopeptide transporter 4 [Triticum urartu]
MGLLSCALMSFLNQFFSYRTEPLIVTQITVQVASLPMGHFLARVLPRRMFRAPAMLGGGEWTLNPGPFNMKEHVLISIFANAGYAFGNGHAYAVGIVDIIRAFYGRSISFLAAWLLITTTQGTLMYVCMYVRTRALHEKEESPKDSWQISRSKFFLVALICSFAWYVVPGYLFPTLTSISWVCWVFSKSVTAQQLGSGLKGLGLGAFTLDWSAVSSFLFSPLISPFFATANIFVGYFLFLYVFVPTAYWGMNLYNAKTFPIFSSHLFMSNGSAYQITDIVNQKFQLDTDAYAKLGRINLSTFFALAYGLNFATIASTITHVGIFYGKEIYHRFRASQTEVPDIHTKLMRKYDDIPAWWFYSLMVLSMTVSLILCTALKDQTPGLNVITEYAMGLIMPGYPVANVCFKVYGYMSMLQAVAFLSDFKLGHYMKIPPRSMFIVQFAGTLVAGTVNLSTAWWLLGSVENICQDQLLSPDSPWTCPGDRVFFDASVIWGLVGPKRIFGTHGNYEAVNWFFLIGAAGPVIVYIFHRIFPSHKWILMINLPVLIGATAQMPAATAMNYNSWLLIGTIFNFFVFRYRKMWWQRYNYILSAALDAGVAFMAVLLYFTLTMENRTVDWWGTGGEHCPLASCPTAKGVDLGPDSVCPVF